MEYKNFYEYEKEELFFSELEEFEKNIILSYNSQGSDGYGEIEYPIFMNDGFCDLDDMGYPKDFSDIDDVLKIDKNKHWKYQIKLYKELLSTADINIKNSKESILDFGCGRGGGISFYKNFYNFDYAVGLDLNFNHIRDAKKHEPNVTFDLSTYKNLPISSNSIDIVTCLESIGYYREVELFIDEIFRITKNNPKVIISTNGKEDFFKTLIEKFEFAGFKILKNRDITNNVSMGVAISKTKFLNISNKIYTILSNDEKKYVARNNSYRILVFTKQ
jgi:ubiquinone/menaquinone biosynthesis C-methylase UbiE